MKNLIEIGDKVKLVSEITCGDPHKLTEIDHIYEIYYVDYTGYYLIVPYRKSEDGKVMNATIPVQLDNIKLVKKNNEQSKKRK